MKNIWLIITLSLAILFQPSLLSASGAYEVEIETKNGKTIKAIATKINENQFLIDNKLVDRARAIFVMDTSVTPAAKVVATLTYSNEPTRVAVITASGVSGEPVLFAKGPQAEGRQLILQVLDKQTTSITHKLQPKKGLVKGNVYSHTAKYAKNEWSAPLLNNCQELVGISVYESTMFTNRVAPETLAYATATENFVSFLDSNKVEYKSAPDACLSDVEQAEKKAQEEKQKADDSVNEAKKKLEDAKKQLDQSSKDAEEAKKKALDDAEKALKDAEEKAKKSNEESQAKLDKKTKEFESLQKQLVEERKKALEAIEENESLQMLLILSGVLIILGLVIFVIILSKRKKTLKNKEEALQEKELAAQSLAEEKAQLSDKVSDLEKTFNDILLDGVTADEQKVRLKINGKALAQAPNGQVIGRESAEVDYALTEGEISRLHLKLTLVDNTVMIEDLNSSNGSWLNDRQLVPGNPVAMQNNDVLRLSSITFKVNVL